MAKSPRSYVFTAWHDNHLWHVKFKRKQYQAERIRFTVVANGDILGRLEGQAEHIVEVEGELVIT